MCLYHAIQFEFCLHIRFELFVFCAALLSELNRINDPEDRIKYELPFDPPDCEPSMPLSTSMTSSSGGGFSTEEFRGNVVRCCLAMGRWCPDCWCCLEREMQMETEMENEHGCGNGNGSWSWSGSGIGTDNGIDMNNGIGIGIDSGLWCEDCYDGWCEDWNQGMMVATAAEAAEITEMMWMMEGLEAQGEDGDGDGDGNIG